MLNFEIREEKVPYRPYSCIQLGCVNNTGWFHCVHIVRYIVHTLALVRANNIYCFLPLITGIKNMSVSAGQIVDFVHLFAYDGCNVELHRLLRYVQLVALQRDVQ